MKLLIDIGHPAHVHFFKHFIWKMRENSHQILITARKKEISQYLLNTYNLDYIPVGIQKQGFHNLIFEWAGREIEILKITRKFQPDILLSIGSPAIAHVSLLLNIPSIIFTDTEHASFNNKITFPFTDNICTPSCYRDNIGPKHIRYEGYQELAYLHPKYFVPNPAVLSEMDLKEDEPFIILRFVSWQASHDAGQHGIQDKIGIINKFEQFGKVFITSEGHLPKELTSYKFKLSPEKIHDVLYYAHLYFGDSPTMTTESAILGTPAICVSSWACDCGNFLDLSTNYDLIFCYKDEKKALDKTIELLSKSDTKKQWKVKSEKMLNEKIDVTQFMIDLVENHPTLPTLNHE